MAYSEKTWTWVLIRKSVNDLNRAGINPIEFLLWSQVRSVPRLETSSHFPGQGY